MLSRFLNPILRTPMLRTPMLNTPMLSTPSLRILTHIRNEHYYTKNHEFIDFIDNTNVRIGISDYAKYQLGDIVYMEVSDTDIEVDKGAEIVTLESVKTVGYINSPADGIITKTNTELIEDIEDYNQTNGLDSWLVEFELLNEIDQTELLSKEDYDKFVSNL